MYWKFIFSLSTVCQDDLSLVLKYSCYPFVAYIHILIQSLWSRTPLRWPWVTSVSWYSHRVQPLPPSATCGVLDYGHELLLLVNRIWQMWCDARTLLWLEYIKEQNLSSSGFEWKKKKCHVQEAPMVRNEGSSQATANKELRPSYQQSANLNYTKNTNKWTLKGILPFSWAFRWHSTLGQYFQSYKKSDGADSAKPCPGS